LIRCPLQKPFQINPALRRAGFTLVEMIAVIGILIILTTLMLGVISRLPGAGDRAKCTANLRALGEAFETYTQDEGHWPQQPEFTDAQQEQYEDWWINTMKPYGITEATWQCPAILRLGKIQRNGRSPRVQYSPTMFDAKQSTPHKWPMMPWLVEIANVHGHGALCILPDGSVHDWDIYMSTLAPK